jgi:hypothetical protein
MGHGDWDLPAGMHDALWLMIASILVEIDEDWATTDRVHINMLDQNDCGTHIQISRNQVAQSGVPGPSCSTAIASSIAWSKKRAIVPRSGVASARASSNKAAMYPRGCRTSWPESVV